MLMLSECQRWWTYRSGVRLIVTATSVTLIPLLVLGIHLAITGGQWLVLGFGLWGALSLITLIFQSRRNLHDKRAW
jgi:hypothetical protein